MLMVAPAWWDVDTQDGAEEFGDEASLTAEIDGRREDGGGVDGEVDEEEASFEPEEQRQEAIAVASLGPGWRALFQIIVVAGVVVFAADGGEEVSEAPEEPQQGSGVVTRKSFDGVDVKIGDEDDGGVDAEEAQRDDNRTGEWEEHDDHGDESHGEEYCCRGYRDRLPATPHGLLAFRP